MRKKKIQQGALITSLDQLSRCEWIIIHGKPYSRGWVLSWQFRMAKMYIDGGYAYFGIRLSNGQYYDKLTDAQIKERFDAELREISPCEKCDLRADCKEPYCWKAVLLWRGRDVS